MKKVIPILILLIMSITPVYAASSDMPEITTIISGKGLSIRTNIPCTIYLQTADRTIGSIHDNLRGVYYGGLKDGVTYQAVAISASGKKATKSITMPGYKESNMPSRIGIYSQKDTSITLKYSPIQQNCEKEMPTMMYVKYSASPNMTNAKTVTAKPNSRGLITASGLKQATCYYMQLGSYYVKDGTNHYERRKISIESVTRAKSLKTYSSAIRSHIQKAIESNKQTRLRFKYPVERRHAQEELLEILVGNYDVTERASIKKHISDDENTRGVLIEPTGYSKTTAQTRVKKINKNVNKIVSKAKKRKNTSSKIKYVDNQLCKRIRYDYRKKASAYTLYGALVNKKATCQGYSMAFYLCCKKLNIPCKIIISSNERHSFNAVKIKGRWRYIDVTWDDKGKSSSRKYYLKTKSEIQRYKSHKF